MFADTPQPPQRPGVWEWMHASEERRCAYEKALVDYLIGAGNQYWFALMTEMAVFYQSHEREGDQDANWRRGGYGC
jgi:hypothetical protein